MNRNNIRKAIEALKWEDAYRKKLKSDPSVSDLFLDTQTRLDIDIEHFLTEHHLSNCSILDIGTGTGEQAIFLSKKGFNVTGIDVSGSAIKNARQVAIANGVEVKFIEDNILFPSLASEFDIIIDRGCFTLISPEFNSEYISSVKKLLKPDGWFLIKADKIKAHRALFLKENKDFKLFFLKESYYEMAGNKQLPAIFFAMKKIAG